MTRRRAIAPLLLLLLFCPSPAPAQSPRGELLITVTAGAGATAARIDVFRSGPSDLRVASTTVQGPDGVARLDIPAGEYLVRVSASGFNSAEKSLLVGAAQALAIRAVLQASPGGEASIIDETDRFPLSYQTAFDERHLDALPHSRTAWSLLETAHPFLVSDHIDGGGLATGERPLLGGQGSSSAQTTFRVNGIDVTDPELTGTPLFFPDLRALGSVTVSAASLDASILGPAPAVDMVLKRPGVTWSGAAEITGAPESMQAGPGAIAPIARLAQWVDGGVAAGGAAGTNAVRLFLAGRASGVKRVEREVPLTLEGSTRAITAHAEARTGRGDAIGILAGFSGATGPLGNRARFADRNQTQSDDNLMLHTSWGRAHDGGQWSIAGGFQRATRDSGVASTAGGGVMERLKDGPPMALFSGGPSSRQRWSVDARLTPAARRWLGTDHVLDAGASIGGAGATAHDRVEPAFGELVNGVPARVWDVSSVGAESHRSSTTVSAFATDRMPINDSLTVTAALRLDVDRGSADGAPDDVSWTTLLPRAHARWRSRGRGPFSITGGYGWYAHRLPLGYLAAGDPAATSGTMYRWDDRNADLLWTGNELTPVAAVGLCCTGGEAARIDSALGRPITREFRIGGEHTVAGWRIGITGLDRREDDLVALVNTGVTAADYTVTYVDDPGVDIAGLQGSAPLPIYNRRPESALRDRYLLTNTSAAPSRFQSFDIVMENEFSTRWFVRFGGSAYRSEGVGTSRGYRSDENDQGMVGEAFLTPNAQTNARGRLFYDRAFIMKVMGGYTAPRIFSGAFVARYQDGQPFARLVLADGLTQGRDLIQTYGRGGQRFTYTVTLDARLAAEWRFAPRRTVGAVLEAFNLLDMANEVEEDVVTGPAFRTITAVQPPRVVRLGVRLTF